MLAKIHQELAYFFSGLSFYTRIPCPAWVKYSPQNLNKSRKYLPLIGLIIGSFAASVFYFCHWLLPASVSIALSMIATVYLTGAFHEDGLADCADGFGGGWDKAQVLSIMKDSRMGAYGTISLVLILGLKYLLLWELQLFSPELMMLALIGGHTLSRLMASVIMQYSTYVSEERSSKSKAVTSVKLNRVELLLSGAPLAVFMAVTPFQFFIAIPFILIMTWLLTKSFTKRIGGYTGDCLGATQQLTEVLFYIVFIATL